MSHRNFLDDDVVLTIRPQFAALLGLNESIIIQQLHYWLKKAERGQCGRLIEGHYWVWNTNSEWLEQFPFFSESTLKRIFSRLKSEGIVLIEQFDGANRTNFHRIDYQKLDKFLENAQKSHEVKMTSCRKTPSGQSDPLEEVNLTPSSGQIDPMYITETPSETSPKSKNTPLTPQGEKEGLKSQKKILTLTEISDLHGFTLSVIEEYIQYRLNSGGIENRDAFLKYVSRGLSEQYSDESVRLEEWFQALTRTDIIDYLVNQFLSTQRTDRRFCRELAKDDFTLKANYIDPSDVVIEIAYQKADAKRRERLGGAA